MYIYKHKCDKGAEYTWPAGKIKPIFSYVYSLSLRMVVLSIGIGMVPSIIDVWGYDREFCSSSSPPPPPPPPSSRVTQKPNNIK